MHNHEVSVGASSYLDVLMYAFPFVFVVSYIVAISRTNRKYKNWPVTRTVFWVIGVFSVFLGVVGPIADRAHASFVAHMMAHLLLGMLGPLLLVLAAPMTLLLRSVPVNYGRLLSKLLKSSYVQWITHPIIASILNAGGLWVLYASDLYNAIHSSILLFVLVHVHIFLAGYVFTLSMIYIEVTPHRTSFRFRAAVLILSMASHGILSKWIYANPPAGTEVADAQLGGMLMYYGGDAIDLVIVIILCYQHFRGSSRTIKDSHYSEVKALEG